MTTEAEEFAAFTASLVSAPAEEPAAETPPEKKPEQEEEKPAAEVTEEKPEDKPKAEKAEEKKKEEPPAKDWKVEFAKERERRAARHAAKQAAEATARELTETRAAKAELDELKALAKADELKALEKLGLTVDRVNTRYVDKIKQNPDTPPPAVSEAQKRIDALEAKLAAMEEKETLRETQAKQARRAESMTSLSADIAKVMAEKPDDFELTSREEKGKEVVINLLAAQLAETGKYDIAEALRDAEEHYRTKVKKHADTKFVRALVAPAESQGINGNMRQSEPRGTTGADEDKEFLATSLRLIKQSGG